MKFPSKIQQARSTTPPALAVTAYVGAAIAIPAISAGVTRDTPIPAASVVSDSVTESESQLYISMLPGNADLQLSGRALNIKTVGRQDDPITSDGRWKCSAKSVQGVASACLPGPRRRIASNGFVSLTGPHQRCWPPLNDRLGHPSNSSSTAACLHTRFRCSSQRLNGVNLKAWGHQSQQSLEATEVHSVVRFELRLEQQCFGVPFPRNPIAHHFISNVVAVSLVVVL